MAFVAAFAALAAGSGAVWFWLTGRKAPTEAEQTPEELKQLVLLNDLTLFEALRGEYRTASMSEEGKKVAASYAAILVHSGGLQAVLPIFHAAVVAEIAAADSPVLFFRGNTFPCKLTMELLRALSHNYLDSLSSKVRTLATSFSDEDALALELMPPSFNPELLNGLTPEQAAQEALPKFFNFCQATLDFILVEPIPDTLKFLLQHAKQQALVKWPEAAHTVVSVLLMLRLVIPSVVMLEDLPASVRRVVIRTGQVIQCIANEHGMKNMPDLTAWAKDREPEMRAFLSAASTTPLSINDISATMKSEEELTLEDMNAIMSFVKNRPPVLAQLKQVSLSSASSSSSSSPQADLAADVDPTVACSSNSATSTPQSDLTTDDMSSKGPSSSSPASLDSPSSSDASSPSD